MARYPESLIEEIRERIDLLEVVGQYVNLKKNGVNWLGLCPFHSEKTPSFNVRPDKGFYKCFGCGKGGDAFDFLIKIKGVDFFEAIEELAGIAGIPLPKLTRDTPKQSQEKQEREKLRQRLASALSFFRQTLHAPHGQLARRYLSDRGLKPETIEKFQLGYAPPGWSNLLDHFGNQESLSKELEKVGLVVRKDEENRQYDRFRDRIIFPIFDLKGHCIAFGGRALGSGQPKYINSPETPLYRKGDILYGLEKNQEAIQREEQVLVVEGYMDLIALANHGIDPVVATLGTALTPNHLRLLWRRTRRILFCFDGDRAGEDAAWRALEQVIDGLKADRTAQFLFLGQNEDPDEVVRREGAAGFKKLMERATPLIDFLIRRLGRGLTLDSPEGRAALVHRVRPFLEKVGDPLLRELYADTVGQRYNIPLHRVVSDRATERKVTPSPPPWIGSAQRSRPGGREENRPGRVFQAPVTFGRDVEQLLLYLLLRKPGRIVEQEDQLGELALENPQFAQLLTDLLGVEAEKLEQEGFDLFNHLSSPGLLATAREILSKEEIIPESEEEELLGCMTAIQIQQTKKELQKAKIKIETDPNTKKEDYDTLLGLKLDLARLQQSKVRSVQSH
ncbi:MAG: DNA primase [Magnetococcales bacterium]|nr:DNA primase [Magnetococcales bacterium]